MSRGALTAQIGLDDAVKISEIINEKYGINMMQLFFSNLEDYYAERRIKTLKLELEKLQAGLEGKNG